MHCPDSTTLKREFLKKWLTGLQACGSHQSMSVLERKKAIKQSADIAMASTRKGRTCWSRALMAHSAQQSKPIFKQMQPATISNNYMRVRRARSKKILKRSNRVRRLGSRGVAVAKSIAKRMVKRRTQVLKKLVPGGESMVDEISLIEETLDYIVSLRAQVDVMRTLAKAVTTIGK